MFTARYAESLYEAGNVLSFKGQMILTPMQVCPLSFTKLLVTVRRLKPH